MFKHSPLPVIELVSQEINGKRFYNVDGELFPSVTTVLSSFTKQGILEWRKRVGEEAANKKTRIAASRGTKLHNMCEDYLNNKEDVYSNRMPSTIDLFKKVKTYLDENIETVYSVEGGLYSKELRTAGRCDLVCRMHGVDCVVDFKTSETPKKEEWIENYFLQETAYAMMVQELYGKYIHYIITIIAAEEQAEPQIFIKKPQDYTDKVKTLFSLYHSNNAQT